MALEALVTNDFYDSTSATQHYSHGSPSTLMSNEICTMNTNFYCDDLLMRPFDLHGNGRCLQQSNTTSSSFMPSKPAVEETKSSTKQPGRKRRRRAKVCKNKEEAETQRMTHITVERNRRRQMNEYLAVLRSLMPESYAQRGDQASIVGGAIEFVKELEQLLQSLEAQKHLLQQQQEEEQHSETTHDSTATTSTINPSGSTTQSTAPPFTQFFTSPQFSWCQDSGERLENGSDIANVEVTLIETHANIRILSQKRPRQLLKLVTGFQTLNFTILHLNVTSSDPYVLYSFSAKVEEGCHLTSVDDIAAATHHMLRLIEEEAAMAEHHNPQHTLGI